MPIYRQTEGGFVPFEEAAPDLEKQLEDWIEENPHLLLEGEPLVVIGRQTTTSFGKALDLLAVDESGACVVIELKRAQPPRDVIAQAMEYTAWVDSQSQDDLDAIAAKYAERNGLEADGTAALYDLVLGHSDEDDDGEAEGATPSDHVTINARQRIVIVAGSFPPEMEQTMRYLRGRLGVDISAVRFSLHRLERETLLEIEVVVGRERTGTVKASAGSSKPTMSHDEIRDDVVTNEFLRVQVDGLEDWINSLDSSVTVRHIRGTHHSIYRGSQSMGGYYFASHWIHVRLKDRIPGDEQAFRGLSQPARAKFRSDLISGNVATQQDLDIFKRQLIARLDPGSGDS